MLAVKQAYEQEQNLQCSLSHHGYLSNGTPIEKKDIQEIYIFHKQKSENWFPMALKASGDT
jgi:hypothetical protein